MTKTIPFKDVNKKLKSGLKQINEAINLLRTHVVIGEVNFPGTERKALRAKKMKVTPAPEGTIDLPDLDKGGYMKKRVE